MTPCKCQFLQQGSEKSMSDNFYCALIGRIRSSVGMLVAPFRALYKRISLLSLFLFFKDFHFSFFSNILSFKAVILLFDHSGTFAHLDPLGQSFGTHLLLCNLI